jgi:hypothetical protein
MSHVKERPILGEVIFRSELIREPSVHFMSLGNAIESRIEQHRRLLRTLLSAASSDSIRYMNDEIIETN